MRLRLELRGNDGNAAGFVIPDEVVEELGGGRRPKVVVTIGSHTWRSSIANMGGQFSSASAWPTGRPPASPRARPWTST